MLALIHATKPKAAGRIAGTYEENNNRVEQRFQKFTEGQFANFTNNAAAALEVLRSRSILPAGDDYFYKNATVNSDGDIQFDMRPKN